MNIVRNALVAFAAVVSIGLAGASQAAVKHVSYTGTTSLTNGVVGTVSCVLTLSGYIDDSGNITVQSGGATPGDSNCALIYVGQFNWTGSTSSSSIATGTDSTIVHQPGTTSVLSSCSGTVSGITYNGTPPFTSSNVPSSITVSGTSNYGSSCSFNGTLVLNNP